MTQPKFPGTPSTADGSGAIVYVETAISEAATAYPITPTTNMGAGYQEKVSNGAQNLWGTPLAFVELESEHSAASLEETLASIARFADCIELVGIPRLADRGSGYPAWGRIATAIGSG